MTTLEWVRRFNRFAGRISPNLSARMARRLLLYPRQLPPKSWEAPALKSAQHVSFRFGLRGLRWGSEGPVVLMMHGWEGRPTQFAHFIPPLLAAGRQVIALQGPGHGEGEGQEATLMEFAAALQEAAVELRDLESVVGHSMGASAAAIALAGGLHADRAVLLAPSSAIERHLYGFARQLALPQPAARRFVRLVEEANGIPARDIEISRLAGRLRVPALIVHDRADTAVPFDEGKAVAQAWPGARLLPTSGLGHWRILSDPNVVNQSVQFLTGQEEEQRDAPRYAAAG